MRRTGSENQKTRSCRRLLPGSARFRFSLRRVVNSCCHVGCRCCSGCVRSTHIPRHGDDRWFAAAGVFGCWWPGLGGQRSNHQPLISPVPPADEKKRCEWRTVHSHLFFVLPFDTVLEPVGDGRVRLFLPSALGHDPNRRAKKAVLLSEPIF